MRTITKQINIYKFDELQEDVRKKLIKEEIEANFEIYCESSLYDDMKYKAVELMNKYFGKQAPVFNKVYYDLSYVQGRGAMFEFDLYYYGKLVHVKHSGYYYHSRSFILETWELSDKQEKQLYNKVLTMFEELETYGDKLIENVLTEDEAVDILRTYEFYEDGSIVNCV